MTIKEDRNLSGRRNRWIQLQLTRGEIQGGIAGAVSSLPQSIAYGVIAFAPLGNEYTVAGALAGIYSSIIGGLVSCIAGSSNIMVSGSRAATSVVFAALLTQLLHSSSLPTSQLLGISFLAVAFSGVIQACLGWIKVGYLVKYVPQTVIAGFLNGSGLLILASQIKPLTGFQLSELLSFSNPQWGNMQWGSLLLGLGTAAMMMSIPKVSKSAPAGLLALILGSAAYHALSQWGNADWVLGGTFPSVDNALPSMTLLSDIVDMLVSGGFVDWFSVIFPAALSIAVISSLDSLLSAAALDNLTLSRTDGNRELIGQGVGNIAVAIMGGTPSSGSMGRSGALYKAGGRRRISVYVNVALLMLILITMASMIELLPKAVVAGVLVVIGIQLFDEWTIRLLRQYRRQWNQLRSDLWVIVAVVAATLIWNLITAVGLGVLLAVIIFMRRMSRSVIRRQYRGSHVHSRQLRDERIADRLVQFGDRIVVLELEGAIFFGSADGLEKEIDRLADEGVDYFVLDMKRVKEIDSTGAFILRRIHQRLTQSCKMLVVSYVDKERRNRNGKTVAVKKDRRRSSQERRLWQVLSGLGLVKSFGESAFLPDTDNALAKCEEHLLADLDDDGACCEFDPFRSGVFSSLSEEEQAVLGSMLRSVKFEVDSAVFQQGEEGDAMYLLTKGMADVMINIPGGRRKRVQTILPGAVFGEMALMDGNHRAASVVIVEDADCLRLSKEDFEVLMAEKPQVALKIFANLGMSFAHRLRSANLMIMELEA